MTTSGQAEQDITNLQNTFFGLFPYLKDHPQRVRDVERREELVTIREQAAVAVDRAVELKNAELSRVSFNVGERLASEEARQRAELEGRLDTLRLQIEADEARAETAKEAADKEEARLRALRDKFAALEL
ncbi:hypothetical protein W02_38270 [Nitrospira sp. KM1]|uniref:hypothetical protein n=1 Tax=Nitrospira sp. KM1 TaxID=1936990 RepID=UPI0013A713EA|nr:hypothetical protein [Nitrospira sp. KM1]BCA56687.1 hypothetical protein W02_38270 [Nitrospira sp. KM1]